MGNGRDSLLKRLETDSSIVACVVFQARDPEALIQSLRQALVAVVDPELSATATAGPPVPQKEPEDPWLKHPQAAEYLGVSQSTLYQYACHQKIECRKLAGRLEYRRSILDKFKDLQVRPANGWRSSRGIIPSALGSGK